MYSRLLRHAAIAALSLVGFTSPAQAEFAGSETCRSCHSEIFSSYSRSGHPYKLNKVEEGAPSFPGGTSPGVPHPPAGYKWKDISYVIGGFGWKARFMDEQGYILTGEGRQYNFANAELGLDAHWVAYEGTEQSVKPYTCGECHTTGWVATGENGPHQDNLPGIHGTWSEPGVTCEACHGASADHVANPTQVKPTTVENCASCHARGEPTSIDANAGLIRHHEQYEDLLASPHSNLACGTCHEPHQSTIYHDGGYKGDAHTCGSCHGNVQIKIEAKKDMACHSCHMPFAAKSAASAMVKFMGGAVPKGDIRSHIQRITTDPDWRMFTDDGNFVRVDDQQRAYLTVDYVCMSCHTSKDREWALNHAQKVH